MIKQVDFYLCFIFIVTLLISLGSRDRGVHFILAAVSAGLVLTSYALNQPICVFIFIGNFLIAFYDAVKSED